MEKFSNFGKYGTKEGKARKAVKGIEKRTKNQSVEALKSLVNAISRDQPSADNIENIPHSRVHQNVQSPHRSTRPLPSYRSGCSVNAHHGAWCTEYQTQARNLVPSCCRTGPIIGMGQTHVPAIDTSMVSAQTYPSGVYGPTPMEGSLTTRQNMEYNRPAMESLRSHFTKNITIPTDVHAGQNRYNVSSANKHLAALEKMVRDLADVHDPPPQVPVNMSYSCPAAVYYSGNNHQSIDPCVEKSYEELQKGRKSSVGDSILKVSSSRSNSAPDNVYQRSGHLNHSNDYPVRQNFVQAQGVKRYHTSTYGNLLRHNFFHPISNVETTQRIPDYEASTQGTQLHRTEDVSNYNDMRSAVTCSSENLQNIQPLSRDSFVQQQQPIKSVNKQPIIQQTTRSRSSTSELVQAPWDNPAPIMHYQPTLYHRFVQQRPIESANKQPIVHQTTLPSYTSSSELVQGPWVNQAPLINYQPTQSHNLVQQKPFEFVNKQLIVQQATLPSYTSRPELVHRGPWVNQAPLINGQPTQSHNVVQQKPIEFVNEQLIMQQTTLPSYTSSSGLVQAPWENQVPIPNRTTEYHYQSTQQNSPEFEIPRNSNVGITETQQNDSDLSFQAIGLTNSEIEDILKNIEISNIIASFGLEQFEKRTYCS